MPEKWYHITDSSSYHVVICQTYPPPCHHRLAKYQAFKSFSRRIMVATDLFGRGMDIERVNIVFNYDMPETSDTYLHRVSGPPSLVSTI